MSEPELQSKQYEAEAMIDKKNNEKVAEISSNSSDASGDYESLLESTGGFGRYQWLLLIVYTLNVWLYTCTLLFMVFGAVFPTETCGAHVVNTTVVNSTEQGPPVDLTSTDFNSTKECATKTYIFYSIVAEWDLARPEVKYIPGLITTLQMVGILIGSCFFGIVSDRCGRRSTLIVLVALNLLFLAIRILSSNWMMYAGMTFLVGFVCGAMLSVNYIYFVEHCISRRRIIFAIVGWSPGCFLLGVLAYFTQHWVYLTLATMTFGVPSLVILIFLKPSPKWCLARGEVASARNILGYIAQFNQVATFKHEMVSGPSATTAATPAITYSYWHLFYSRQATIQCIAIIYTWWNVTIVYYGISFGMSALAGNLYTNFILSNAISYIGCVVVALLDMRVKAIGRRHVILSTLTVQTLCMVYILLAYSTTLAEQNPLSITVVAVVGIVANQIAWVPAEMVIPEFFPTELRTMGYTINMSTSKVVAILAPQVLHLMDLWKPAPFLLFAVVSLSGLVTNWFLFPETKNKDLPDLPNRNPLGWCMGSASEIDNGDEIEDIEI